MKNKKRARHLMDKKVQFEDEIEQLMRKGDNLESVIAEREAKYEGLKKQAQALKQVLCSIKNHLLKCFALASACDTKYIS